ncbi:MAG: undecaprenyldiphospho-muramoylpentapeptide beta-N-acetylglucosaminyltransferase [Candidatus Omnitrophota bacterium]
MRIMIVCGGSGGHFYPGAVLAETLTSRNHNVLVVVGAGERVPFNVQDISYQIKKIPAAKIDRFFSFNTLTFLVKLVKAAVVALRIITDFKPDVAVGFGSYVAVPLMVMARLKHIPLVIHEQNVSPGKANRFLAYFARVIALSFEETKAYFKNNNKCVVTGNVLRKNIHQHDSPETYDFFKFAPQSFTLLVLGGSQGSKIINKTFLKAIQQLSSFERNMLQLVHISGDKDEPWLRFEYQKIHLKAKVFSYLKNIEHAYAIADLVICRAGATTIAELIALHKPAVIIPYPYAGAHQVHNAEILGKVNAAVVIKQENLSAQLLKDCILSHWQNKRLAEMQKNFYRIKIPVGRKVLPLLLEKIFQQNESVAGDSTDKR